MPFKKKSVIYFYFTTIKQQALSSFSVCETFKYCTNWVFLRQEGDAETDSLLLVSLITGLIVHVPSSLLCPCMLVSGRKSTAKTNNCSESLCSVCLFFTWEARSSRTSHLCCPTWQYRQRLLFVGSHVISSALCSVHTSFIQNLNLMCCTWEPYQLNFAVFLQRLLLLRMSQRCLTPQKTTLKKPF